jgi:hypothetical protein
MSVNNRCGNPCIRSFHQNILNREDSGSSILQHLRELESGVFYLGKNVALRCEFKYDSNSSTTQTPKAEFWFIATPLLTRGFLLTGVFKIDPQNFFFTSDTRYNASSALNTRFEQIKPHCRLIPIHRHPELSFSSTDFPTIISNIQAIEKKGLDQKDKRMLVLLVNIKDLQ